MPSFPSAGIVTPTQINPHYDTQLSKVGNQFRDFATALGKLPQDINAYKQLEQRKANLTQLKQDLTTDILSEFGKEWKEGEKKRFLADVQNAKDPDTLIDLGTTLMVNRSYQKENGLKIAPLWKQRDYIEFVKPFHEKNLSEQQVTAAQNEKYKGPATAAAAKGGGYNELTGTTKEYLNTKHTPLDELKAERDRLRQQLNSAKDWEAKVEQARDNNRSLEGQAITVKSKVDGLEKQKRDIEKSRGQLKKQWEEQDKELGQPTPKEAQDRKAQLQALDQQEAQIEEQKKQYELHKYDIKIEKTINDDAIRKAEKLGPNAGPISTLRNEARENLNRLQGTAIINPDFIPPDQRGGSVANPVYGPQPQPAQGIIPANRVKHKKPLSAFMK